MKVFSGDITKYLYFVALDVTDLKTREVGLTGFTVNRSRNGATEVAMTTPTTVEIGNGKYALLMDEDMTIGSGNDAEEMIFDILHASMADVSRTITLERSKITLGSTSVAQTADHTAAIADIPTVAEFNARTILSASYALEASITALNDVAATDIVSSGAITTLAGAVVNVDLVDTCTTNSDQRGTDNAFLAASYTAPDNAGIASNGVAIAALPTAAQNRAEMDANSVQIGAGAALELSQIILTAGDALPNIVLAGSGTSDGIAFTRSGSGDPFDTNFITQMQAGLALAAVCTETRLAELDAANLPTDIAAIPTNPLLATAMAESYAAKGVAPTPAQAFYAILQYLYERKVVGTTETIDKLDGTTAAITSTLDSATAPTDKTRAT